MRAVAAVWIVLSFGCVRAPEPRELVLVLLVDGLSPAAVTSEAMPALTELAASEGATFWAEARAVMPSVTNTNHVSVVTGAYAAAHGITGNYFWDRTKPPGLEGLDRPELLEAATLFTMVARERPRFVTAGAFGKPKLARLFAGGGRQRAPDHLWTTGADAPFASDERTMTEALRILDAAEPDFLFVALADVDLTSHRYGPTSDEVRKAVAVADRQVARLVGHLHDAGRWERTVLFVTADHSFTSLVPGETNPSPMISIARELERAGIGERFVAVSDGTLGHVYRRRSREAGPGDLGRAAEVLRAVPGVASVWAVAEGGEPGVTTLAAEYPDWRLGHPRAGDLVVLARPGHHFNDPFHPRVAAFLGQHGGTEERPVPMLAAGGHPMLRPGVRRLADPADNADLGATVLALLGLVPSDAKGEPIGAALRGRVLAEAFRGTPLESAFRDPSGRGAGDERRR